MQSDCTLTLAQLEPTLGNLNENLAKHLETIDAALAAGSRMVLFPELSLTGYFLKDQTADVARRLDGPELEALLERSMEISIGVGFVERGSDDRLYNSWAFLEDGRVVHVHRKVHLVSYGMFEETRDLAPGHDFRAFDCKHGRFGVLLCEDAWHAGSAYLYFLAEVDGILIPSSGPGRGVSASEDGFASTRVWRTLTDSMSMLYQSYVAYVNRVGFEDGILFGGGTRLIDPFGRETDILEGIDPGLVHTKLSASAIRRARVATPLRRDEKPWILAREMKRVRAEGLAK